MKTSWKMRASNASGGMIADREEFARGLRLLIDPEHGCEVLTLFAGKAAMVTLHGDDIEGIIAAADGLPGGIGLYTRLNPIPATLTKSANNDDVIKRRWLYIDVDPLKAEGQIDNSATDAEKEGTKLVASSINEFLASMQWPPPIVLDSGNGTNLLWRIEQTTGKEFTSEYRGFLKALSAKFQDQPGMIDKSIHNLNRLVKVPGTWAKKGVVSDDRPHRQARIVFVPKSLELVTTEMVFKAREAAEKKDDKPKSDDLELNGSAFTLKATSGGKGGYIRAVIEGELARVALASSGERNNCTNHASFRIAQLAEDGGINLDEIGEEIASRAVQIGLDESEIWPTIRSGFEAGLKKPRKVPEQPKERERWKPPEKNKQQSVKTIYALDELLNLELPEPRWAVPGLLSEGLSILAGKPKLGKSWMALNLAMTLAAGGMALGSIRVQPSDVLYLALEDRVRRIQDRARKVMKGLGSKVNNRLKFAVAWPRQDQGGVMALAEWAESVDNPMLIIIDVWAKFRAPATNKSSAYEQDYDQLSEVKSCADHYGSSVLAVHHTRKSAAEDVFDEISGTLGIAGAADGSMVLSRARNQNEGTLAMTGRDIEEQTLSVKFDPNTFCWTSLGKDDEKVHGELQKKVIAFLRTVPHSFAKEIASMIGAKEDSTRVVLYKLVREGIIRKHGNGFAYPVEPAEETDEDTF